jgi:23S rRNA (adenine1618-N6)-methyltransferase
MAVEKKIHPELKLELHSRNKHRERYNFKALIGASSELGAFVAKNKFGMSQSIFQIQLQLRP